MLVTIERDSFLRWVKQNTLRTINWCVSSENAFKKINLVSDNDGLLV